MKSDPGAPGRHSHDQTRGEFEAADATHASTETMVPEFAQPQFSRRRFPWRMLIEKIPLVALSFIDCLITLFTQGDGGALQSLELVSWKARIANTPIAYANYIGSFFWPRGLAVLYPHPLDGFNTNEAVLKTFMLAVVTTVILIHWRRMPYLLVGWLWYLVTLLPVIGLLQVGGQSMADRYTYLPQIGLAIAVVWTLAAATERLGIRAIPALASAAILAALAAAAWLQTTYWRDSESLWTRELSFPQYNNPVSHYNFGLVLAEKGNHRAAVEQYEAGLLRDPTDEASLLNLGLSYEALGSADAAIAQYRKVLEVNAKSASGHNNLARLLQARGDDRQAVEQLRAAHEEESLNYTTCSQLAVLLAASLDDSLRDGGEALRLARRAVELSKDNDAAALDARAAASAEAGDFAAAAADAEAALKLAASGGDNKLAAEIGDRLDLYRLGKPFRLKSRSHDRARNPPQTQNQTHTIEESKHMPPGIATAANLKRKS
jgi:tetratricopeptide (TPR) repeat protein